MAVDSQFLKPQPFLKLVRKVEMLQWQQTKSSKQTTNLGGSTTTTTEYNYNKEWSASRIDSQHFKESAKYSNPNFVIASSEFTPNEITFDAYNGKNIISRIAAEKKIQITNEQLSPAVDTFMSQNGFLSKRINGNYIYFYKGSTQTEDLGDIRVSFTGVSSAYYSVIASPTATNDLQPYVTANNENFFVVEKGNLKRPQMIQGEEKRESTKTWILRLIGLLMMWFGSYLVFRPISLFFEILPILGTIVGQSIGIITGTVSLILAASTILVAKVFHNPVYLMVICGIVTICCFRIFRRKKNESFNASSTFNNFHRKIQ